MVPPKLVRALPKDFLRRRAGAQDSCDVAIDIVQKILPASDQRAVEKFDAVENKVIRRRRFDVGVGADDPPRIRYVVPDLLGAGDGIDFLSGSADSDGHYSILNNAAE